MEWRQGIRERAVFGGVSFSLSPVLGGEGARGSHCHGGMICPPNASPHKMSGSTKRKESAVPSATSVAKRPAVIIVRDGWGKNPFPQWDHANAVKLAKHPVADRLMATYPNVLIATSGFDVGLPEGTMGNSEVGHQNIGAGRIVDQESVRITKAIRTGEFFDNQTLNAAVTNALEKQTNLHLFGIVS